MLLADTEIRKRCRAIAYSEKPMIDPFVEGVQSNDIISYGLTSAGYDLRMGLEVLIFKNSFGEAIDPKRFKDQTYLDRMFDKLTYKHMPPDVLNGERLSITIPAHGYILATSYEYLRIPRYLKARCVGKSTYARCGLIVNTTPLEPEWEGNLTIEISNSAPCPSTIYIMEGIAQLEFEQIYGNVETSYKDKKGKYDQQIGVTPARVL